MRTEVLHGAGYRGGGRGGIWGPGTLAWESRLPGGVVIGWPGLRTLSCLFLGPLLAPWWGRGGGSIWGACFEIYVPCTHTSFAMVTLTFPWSSKERERNRAAVANLRGVVVVAAQLTSIAVKKVE